MASRPASNHRTLDPTTDSIPVHHRQDVPDPEAEKGVQKKIILFGGSISQGVVFDPERNRYQLLKNCFGNLIQEQLNAAVIRRGKIGNSLKQAMKRLKKDVLDEKPDFAVIEFGGNDSDFDWEQVAQAPAEKHQPKTELREFETLLRDLINILKAHDITPVLFTLLPASAEQYIHWLTKDAPEKRTQIIRYLGGIQNLADLHLKYDAVIRKVTEETGTLTIDIRKSMLGEGGDYLRYFCVDGIHPNEDGHAYFARVILEFFRENHPSLVKESAVSRFVRFLKKTADELFGD